MNKGTMQVFAIILLILSSLMLLSIRFELFILSGANETGFVSDKSALRHSVRPESITIRTGQEKTAKLIDKDGLYYLDIYDILEDALKKRQSPREISLSEYRAAKASKSVVLGYEPAIDQRLLYGSLFLQDGSLGSMDNIKEITLPQTLKNAIYIEAEGEKYYEIQSSPVSLIEGFENWGAGSPGSTKYYSIGDRFPQYTDSDVLISDDVRLSSYVTESLFDEATANTVLRNIFASKYDYANRISETDGSVILTYDYGREIIKISPEGKVFYKNQNALTNKKKTSFTEASAAAMGFLALLTDDLDNYYIEEVNETKKGDSTGFEFALSQAHEGVRLSHKNDSPTIRISVINGKVFYLDAIFRKPSVAVDNTLAFGENAVLYVLEQNIDYIKQKEDFASAKDLFNLISSVEYSYIYSDNYNYIACIKMKIGKTTFFFKISDAKVVT